MNQQDIEQTILKETRGLSLSALQEILDFIQFIKTKGCGTATDTKDEAILKELKDFEMDSFTHLEKEFANYKERYPSE